MFERFDLQARRAVFFARLQASQEGHETIDLVCLALGLRDAVDRGARAIESLPSDASREMPLSEGSKQVLVRCVELADAESSYQVTALHLALALGETRDDSTLALLESLPSPGEWFGQDASPLLRLAVRLIGLGNVGRALVDQILEHRQVHAQGYRLRFELRGLADSSGELSLPPATPDEQIRALLQYKRAGNQLARHSDFRAADPARLFEQWAERPGLLVDCSAADTSRLLAEALGRAWGVVTANKKPLTGPFAAFQSLAGDRPAGSRLRWESTVGAGLPLVASLQRLRAAGDPVHSITGSLSSTLGYLMSGLARHEAFSQLVQEVRAAGYTEPDPREDLSGRDVARKALILARTLGWQMELSDVQREGLLPAELETLHQDDFWEQLPGLDEHWRAAAGKAESQGETLRYGFRLNPGGARVGVLSVKADSPLGRLEGTNQLVEIHSRCYAETPLVIQGRGAGVQATAAGVLSDMVELGQRLAAAGL